MLKDLKEKIKIDVKVWLSHIEYQFLPKLCFGLFFLSKISTYCLSQ